MDAPSNTEVADLLEQALGFMNDSGAHWTQNAYHRWSEDTGSQYCSVGAINKAAGLDNVTAIYTKTYGQHPLRDAAIEELAKGLRGGEYAIKPWDRITNWNDNDRRKWPDIVSRFQKTIKRLREA